MDFWKKNLILVTQNDKVKKIQQLNIDFSVKYVLFREEFKFRRCLNTS